MKSIGEIVDSLTIR
ncbi:Protein of unknown function [Bacillus mycoides]|nr:Protein of unknown function [Bacillus mycoides]